MPPKRRQSSKAQAVTPERLLIVFGWTGLPRIVAYEGNVVGQAIRDYATDLLLDIVPEALVYSQTDRRGVWVCDATVPEGHSPRQAVTGTFREPTQDELVAVFSGQNPWTKEEQCSS